MFYIHQTCCISAHQTFPDANLDTLFESANMKLEAIEPSYADVPPAMLRRMSKAVRMGVGAALALLKNNPQPDGIIIGTANSGQEDCVKFLNQIIEYKEGVLTPMSFVQGTSNAVAAQIGLLNSNRGYNISHVHLGLAFEFAVTDADMLLTENPSNNYLLGAVDDISSYNYIFEKKSGWFKEATVSNKTLYETNSPGSITGEGAALFLVNKKQTGAIAKLQAVDTLHSEDEHVVKEKMRLFIEKQLPVGEKIELLLTGENGDNRLNKYYANCEFLLGDEVAIARFKHISGEYPTASAMAVFLCCSILQKQVIPTHMIKKPGINNYRNIFIYNTYKGIQHSFILISVPA
jgi:hypothetical protein